MRERYVYQSSNKVFPPVEKQTEYVDAGVVTFGIEYRLLTAAIHAANIGKAVVGAKTDLSSGYDKGVTLHIFVNEGGERTERIRFDSFGEDPHYHYMDPANNSNELLGIDPSAVGDPLAWALDVIRTRLPQILARSGADHLSKQVEQSKIDEALPKVAEAAYRARFRSDDETVHKNAVNVQAMSC